MYCHICGAPLSENSSFCAYCGTPVVPVSQMREIYRDDPVTKRKKKKKGRFITLKILLIIICAGLVAAGIYMIPVNIAAAREGKPAQFSFFGSGDTQNNELLTLPEDSETVSWEFAEAASGENSREDALENHELYGWFSKDYEDANQEENK